MQAREWNTTRLQGDNEIIGFAKDRGDQQGCKSLTPRYGK